jgi:hypothetical protein
MANTFFDDIVRMTKEARDISQLEYDATVLFKKLKRTVEDMIRRRATLGFSDVNVDIGLFGHLDFTSKWSVSDLLHKVIVSGYVPVAERLFGAARTPFTGFTIAEISARVFKIDWGHGMSERKTTANVTVKQEPSYDTWGRDDLPTTEEFNLFFTDMFLNND